MNWNTLLQPTSSSTPNGNSSSATYDNLTPARWAASRS